MLGAIIGDIVGSVYEFDNHRSKDFELLTSDSFYTDDTVLTVATADVLMQNLDFAQTYKQYARDYPGRGYGGMFARWVNSSSLEPYNSLGNGSAMRVSPIGWAFNTKDEVLYWAKKSAEVTHNHPEGVKGAQAVALAIFLARQNYTLQDLKKVMTSDFDWSFEASIDVIRKWYEFDETCEGTVPVALQAVFEAVSFEDAIRNAISIGGDSDTVACIAGAVAEPLFGIPTQIRTDSLKYLPTEFKNIISVFENKYIHKETL